MIFEIRAPKTSREWQWGQHFVGGLYNILLMITGVSFGKGDWVSGTILAFITFAINRISSEISYQTSKRLFEEHGGKNDKV
ncbi:MAG: hypothetical protein WA130_01855 [Candidatus Methanoperedens sp.]